mmetsp:Transcript_49294/g.100676  ORF Transcript_49294/g.100676 Transcript_49294/m.100676 type:complete len:90 (+) Transcript_49294:1-270(+)
MTAAWSSSELIGELEASESAEPTEPMEDVRVRYSHDIVYWCTGDNRRCLCNAFLCRSDAGCLVGVEADSFDAGARENACWFFLFVMLLL